MVKLNAEVKNQLSKMVVTCGEFKKTVLKIFEATFAPRFKERTRAKLSIFDGYSFDKMCNDLVKKSNEIKDRKDKYVTTGNDVVFNADDIESLIDILNKYVSNEAVQNSFPKRVKKTVNSIATLGSKKATGIKYDDLLKVIDWMRVDVGWLTVTAKKYGGLKNDAKNEVWRPDYSFVEMYRDLMEKVQEIQLNKFQANEKEKATFGSAEIEELISILQKYKGKESPYKLSVVEEVIGILRKPLVYTNHDISLQYFGEVITKKLSPLYQKKDSDAGEADCWSKLEEEADKWNDDDLFSYSNWGYFFQHYTNARNSNWISKKKVKILDEVMTIMQANAERNSQMIGRTKSGYRKALEDARTFADMQTRLECFAAAVERIYNTQPFKRLKKKFTDFALPPGGYESTLKYVPELKDMEKECRNAMCMLDCDSFNMSSGSLSINYDKLKKNWPEILRYVAYKYYKENSGKVISSLKKVYGELRSIKNTQDMFSNFEQSLKVYCLHDKNNGKIQDICDYLKGGLEVCSNPVIVEGLFDKKLNPVRLEYAKETILDRCDTNPSGYDTSAINKFVDKLKTEKF